jgi:hypothetical protein
MGESLFFNKQQWSWVGEVLETVEPRVGDFFRVDLEDLERFPYDLRTLAELERQEKTRRALAQVCKYEYQREVPPLNLRRREFYRICLQDDKILNTVEAELPFMLKPLLLYVVTHELIHVIRFSLEPLRFYLDFKEKETEERYVHRMTYEILKSFTDPYIGPLLERYRPWWQGQGGGLDSGSPSLDKFGDGV